MPTDNLGRQTSPADTAIAFARKQIGKPYVFGATGPDTFDCSGLIQAAYKAAGISISRVTYTQVNDGVAVPANDAALLPGDLRFPDPGHVQLYVGNGRVIEAPHPGAYVQEVPVWGKVWAARRVTTPGTVGGVTPTISDVITIADPLDNIPFLKQIKGVVDLVSTPWSWYRLFLFLIGVVLLIIGIVGMFPGVKGVVKSAAKR